MYKTSAAWTASRFALVAFFLGVALVAPRVYASGVLPPAASRAAFVAGAVALAGVWQQSGFLMHDFMHSHVFHNRSIDHRLGWFFGCCGFGVSSKWWRDEHHEHHLFTNTVEPGLGVTDPQYDPPEFWAQAPELFEMHKTPAWLLRQLLKVRPVEAARWTTE